MSGYLIPLTAKLLILPERSEVLYGTENAKIFIISSSQKDDR
jgi:hypothetical protein